jgi:hypothetical protein
MRSVAKLRRHSLTVLLIPTYLECASLLAPCFGAARCAKPGLNVWLFFVPLTKADYRWSQVFSIPPAAKYAAKLSQSFDSLAKGDKCRDSSAQLAAARERRRSKLRA